MSGKSDNPNFVAILGRAFQIMDCILESPEPIGVSQISKLTEIPKANTFRILKTLEELDAITEIGDGYVLSTQLIKYGNGAKRHAGMLCNFFYTAQNYHLCVNDYILLYFKEFVNTK